MSIEFDPESNVSQQINAEWVDTYVIFRSQIPKPSSEDAHIKHILRYYVSRALLKQEKDAVYTLPEVMHEGEKIPIDVLAVKDGKYTLAICEPESITPETEAVLELLKHEDNVEVVVLHSQYGDPGNVEEKFKAEINSDKFRILAVVPPPFDDVYEYDIWMFETTFRELFRG